MHRLGPDQLQAWVRRALPGEDVTYWSHAERPDPVVAAVARTLCDAGLVSLCARRERGGFRFIAQRSPVALSVLDEQRPVNRGRFRRKAVRASAETMIYRALRQAAERGWPCPTNAELARIACLSGAVSASYRVRRLVAAGRIVVEEPGPLERRVVTIVATGKATVRGVL